MCLNTPAAAGSEPRMCLSRARFTDPPRDEVESEETDLDFVLEGALASPQMGREVEWRPSGPARRAHLAQAQREGT